MVVLIVAAFLRFWQPGAVPPGLYRDEAYNALDALAVLDGEHALFFPANNGREPAYIYLTALSVQLFGRSVAAVRLPAVLIGTLTTIPLYLLANAWFGRRTALLAAWFWAVSFWPLHLSRIGLRPVLLAPLLALTFWLGTLAYRRQRPLLWFLAGVLYGLAFYTYLPVRFTPLLLAAVVLFLLRRPERRAALWPGVLFFAAGTALLLFPLAILFVQSPALLLGRAAQVSILNPAINGGDLWGTLWQQSGRVLGMYFWRGDTIWRHNFAGRPIFDLFLAIPFLLGVLYCVRHWRRPACFALLSWQLILLAPTLLAEDAPHFLRASGVLPALFILPALGLSKLADWPKLPPVLQRQWSPHTRRRVHQALIGIVMLATFFLSVRDYFFRYARRPETAYYFENAARSLAEALNAEPAGTALYLDDRYWNGSWPAINFLVRPQQAQRVTPYHPENGLPCAPDCPLPLAVYAWPYTTLDFLPQALSAPLAVAAENGPLARGDLEAEAYPFYVRYAAAPPAASAEPLATFGDLFQLWQAEATRPEPQQLQVTLLLSATRPPEPDWWVFLHVLDERGTIIGQHAGLPAGGYWPYAWWQVGLWVQDRRTLSQSFDSTRHRLVAGLFNSRTGERLPVFDHNGTPAGDTWPIPLDD